MAREETDREDLMREATALVNRVELAIPDREATIILGVKRRGDLSCYFGADPVYHFDAENRLRRAYFAGNLYRSQGLTLSRLVRVRTETETVLQRTDLSEAELAEFLDGMCSTIQELLSASATGAMRTVKQVPEDGEFLTNFLGRLTDVMNSPELSPAIKG